MTKIAPASQFNGDVQKSSWLPSKEIAFIYRAYATYDNPLSMTSPSASLSGRRVWDAGSNVTVVVDATKFAGWK